MTEIQIRNDELMQLATYVSNGTIGNTNAKDVAARLTAYIARRHKELK